MARKPTWGIVSTIRGSAPDILEFAAYHLDLGLDRMYLFLDEPNPQAFEALRAHPKIDVWVCDAAFWARRKRDRPDKHQVRQTANATCTYRKTDLNWLAHIDLDEFLWPKRPVPDLLAQIPDDIPAARTRPIEALATGKDLYKAFIPKGRGRDTLVQTLYPTYGAFVLGGFLSHIQGKLFVRTGMSKINFRIHNLFQNGEILRECVELDNMDLCHRHAPDWEHWLAHYPFRIARGSYQPGMSPNVARERGGVNMNELLGMIEAEDGMEGLRRFFDEMSGADPATRTRLEDHGMIRHRPLDLDAKVAKHFPGTN